MSDEPGGSCCSGGGCSAAPEVATVSVGPSLAFRVHGLCCAEEVATLKRALRDVTDPDHLGFDILEGRMTVPPSTDPEALVRAVAATGMRAEPWGSIETGEDARTWSARDALTAVSGLALVLGFVTHAVLSGVEAAIGSEGAGLVSSTPWGACLLYLMAIGSGLWLVLPRALYSARTLRPDMNLLMTVAVAGAVALGEWFEAGTVAFLFALSLTLESWSVGRAREAVAALMSLAPDTVRVLRGGQSVEVAPDQVTPGERFVVLPGERFPLDGRVAVGASEVDQAPITGESMPVSKGVDDGVFAGTINGSGALEVESTRPAEDTTLARIARLAADSQANRSESEQWVDRFARIYTPLVFGAALLVAVVPPLAVGGAWSEWIYRGLVLLVIGCPCALVISTPVSIVAAVAAAASQGVLVKGGKMMEVPAHLDVIALDKTGTLTDGHPRVVAVVPLGEHDEAAVLARAAGIERRSEHPVARAILEYAQARGVRPVETEAVRAVPGRGAEGTVQGRRVWVGSHRWLAEQGQQTPALRARLDELASTGRTAVVVGDETQVVGLIAVADGLRDNAAASVEALHRAGVARIVMLTGDNEPTARAIAARAGIDEVRAELLPEDKVRAIDELERSGLRVAMVGDGVNDAPALARASLGVAMGAAGTDVAIETADIALMGDDLSKLAWLVRHSRRTLAIIRQNTAFALGVKVLFVVLTFAGVASLWGAIAADMGASILVVFNALRLLTATNTDPAAAPIRRTP